MKKYKNGDEFKSNLGDDETTVVFYMSTCPFCKLFCPEYEKKYGNKPNYAMVALDTDEDEAWDDYSIQIVPTVLVFKDKKIMKRYDGRPGLGLDINDIN